MSGEMYRDNKTHWVFALLLGIAGLLILLIFINLRSKADDSTTTVTTSSSAPTLSTPLMCDENASYSSGVVCSSGDTAITLTESDYTGMTGGNDIYISSTVTDVDTIDEFDNQGYGAITYYVTTSTGMNGCAPGATESDRDCYSRTNQARGSGFSNTTVGECYFASYTASATTATFACKVHLAANAMPWPTWYAKIKAMDGASNMVFGTSASFSVATSTGLALSGNISYQLSSAAIPVGSVSDASTVTVANSGNVTTDYKVLVSDMGCSRGAAISGYGSTAQIGYSTSMASFTVGNKTNSASSSASATRVRASIAAPTSSSTLSTGNFYTKLQVPSGSGGSCNGTITFTACDNVYISGTACS
jgi:hypothetical protein